MYAKLFASLYQGTLRGNGDAILVFTNLLAHADSTGAVDKHFRAIADEVGLSIDRVKTAIEFLESPDEESRSPEHEGRRLIPLDEHRAWGWQIVNHGKYRSIRNEDDRREQNREAQKRWRERHQSKAERNDDISDVSRVSRDKPIQKQKQKQIQKKRERDRQSAMPSNPTDADASDTLSVQDAGGPTPTSDPDASPSSPLRVSAEGVASLNGAARPGRGSRLPDTFLLTAAMRAYAESRAPEIDVMLETEKFVNYFRAASGAKGVKLDWEATWRNWILNAKKFATDKEPVTQKKQGIVW